MDRILCSGENCMNTFSEDWNELGYSYIELGKIPICEEDKFDKIFVALMKTRVFCKKCCNTYTGLIYNNSKINFEVDEG